MQLTRDFLLTLDDQQLVELSVSDPSGLYTIASFFLAEFKLGRERIEQNSSNSSTPSGRLPPWGDRGSAGSDEIDSDEENPAVGSFHAASGAQSNDENKRKPSRQRGSQGFGRTQSLATNSTEHHYCETCSQCGASIRDNAQVAYSSFQTLDVVFGATESPGLLLINTRHRFYRAHCASCDAQSRCEPWREIGSGEWANVSLAQ